MNELEEFEKKLKEVASKQNYSPTIFDKCLEKHPEYKEYIGRYVGTEFNLWCEKTKELYEISKKEGLIDPDMSFEKFLGMTLEDIKHNCELFNKLEI